MTTPTLQPFRGLPFTPEQDTEIRSYIERCEANGTSWDTLALDYLIIEMLYPPPSDERLDFCDEYARNLANHIRLAGETIDGSTRETHAQAFGMCTEAEWKWIVRETIRLL